ncbi:MAG: transglycosylase domain-containing protein, partial [Acidobacteria bacterium]|nr:transglycosylase domain-containing protein [Acidobacteriota bacterium]
MRPAHARPPWARYALLAAAALAVLSIGTLAWYYVSFSRLIDARLHGERERTLPRVYARPFELRRGQALTPQDLVARLNDLGYAQRPRAEAPGEFTLERNALIIRPRSGDLGSAPLRVTFGGGIQRLEVGRTTRDAVQLEAPLLTALMSSGGRQKRRSVPLATIPASMQQAVLAIEDQGFYSHPGINPIRMLAAAVTNLFGDNPTLVGYSTITQQLARMFFLADEFNAELTAGQRSYGRKIREALM